VLSEAAELAPQPLSRSVSNQMPERVQLPIESKYMAIAAAVGFMITLMITHGSLMYALGVLALIAGVGWVARRIFH
jgi:hypothetical protein